MNYLSLESRDSELSQLFNSLPKKPITNVAISYYKVMNIESPTLFTSYIASTIPVTNKSRRRYMEELTLPRKPTIYWTRTY